MKGGRRPQQSLARIYIVPGVIALIPVLVLGIALNRSYKAEASHQDRPAAEAAATLVAQTAVQPRLDPAHPANQPLTPVEIENLKSVDDKVIGSSSSDQGTTKTGRVAVLGMTVRDCVRPIDPITQKPKTDPATGQLVCLPGAPRWTSDVAPAKPGEKPITVSVPLRAGDPTTQVGFIEMTLLNTHPGAGMFSRDLIIGFGALYVSLFFISLFTSWGLRKENAINAFLAEHDNLTDLPNRTLFHREAEAAIKAADGEQQTAVAIIDLDRFKDVNDTLGHHYGDRLLTELARRLDINTRPEDTVARLGGDEFGVVLSNVADAEEALWRLRSVIDREVEVSGLPVSVESSVGYVVAPDDGTDVDDLMQRADVAMYVAKGQHSGIVRYDPEQDEYDATKLGLVAQLRQAIDAGELVLHYQPKAALSDGRIEAVEALVRWDHPTKGMLYPDSFIPVAEQTDIIDKLTDWALATALAEIKDVGGSRSRLAVAVNVSARSLSKPDFARRVQSALDVAGVPATRLIIEITETALVADPARAKAILAQLEAVGVRISIDDFGQGATSFGFLPTLPVHELKIDMAFVRDMLENAVHAAIVRSIIYTGHSMDLRVIAEGVETEEVLASLLEAGCDVAQGFLIAKPMPAEKLHPWLRERGVRSAPRVRRRPLTTKKREPVA